MADTKLRVNILGDASSLSRSLSRASTQLSQFGGRVKAIGSSLRAIQLPIALAGGAAIKMAMDFDRSMTQIESLVGVASDEVARMGETAKRMAADTGRSANEAAEALFFITSAGLRGEEAMQVLEASLKAAAVGLGETKIVADLATSAMNAYGSDVLSAADATDVMVSAVREGKLEASELAGSMGRVLPVASAMGVRFDEVGAAFAALSRTGTNAAEAATQIRGILTSLLKPTKEASDTLAEMGLSTQSLRQQIREKGLLSALETLKQNFDGNDEAAQRVFGNVRALSGIMDLLGANVATTRAIFDSMTGSAGATATAFGKVEQSASFRLTKALNGLRGSFTELGATLLSALLPHIQKLTNFITNAFKGFQDLTPMVKGLVIAFGSFALVLPTVLSILGGLISAFGALLSPIGLVIGAIAGVTYAIVKNWEPVKKTIVDVINYFIDLYNESEGFRIVIQSIGQIFKSVFEIGKIVFESLWRIIKEVASNIIKGFENVGKVIRGVFTLDPDLIQEGITGGLSAAFSNIATIVQEATGLVQDAGKILYDNLKQGVEKAKVADPINPITGEDIDGFLSGIKDRIVNAGKTISGWFSSGIKQESQAAGGGQLAEAFSLSDLTQNVQSTMGASLMIIGASFDSITERAARFTEFVKNNAVGIGQSLAGAFNRLFEAKNPIKEIGQMILGLIKRLAAAALAAFVLSSILGGLGGAKRFGDIANFSSLFGAISGFGGMGGGMAAPASPGLNLGGVSNVAAGQNVNVTGQFRIDGQDLVVAFNRANNQRGNFIG